jgi:hypothetical protein
LSNTIERYTSAGAASLFANSGLIGPEGLAFDSAGNLYAANESTIEEFSPTGVDLGAFASSGLSGPADLAFTDDAGVPLKLANQTPEPSTWAMLAFGLPALLARRRGRQRFSGDAPI